MNNVRDFGRPKPPEGLLTVIVPPNVINPNLASLIKVPNSRHSEYVVESHVTPCNNGRDGGALSRPAVSMDVPPNQGKPNKSQASASPGNFRRNLHCNDNSTKTQGFAQAAQPSVKLSEPKGFPNVTEAQTGQPPFSVSSRRNLGQAAMPTGPSRELRDFAGVNARSIATTFQPPTTTETMIPLENNKFKTKAMVHHPAEISSSPHGNRHASGMQVNVFPNRDGYGEQVMVQTDANERIDVVTGTGPNRNGSEIIIEIPSPQPQQYLFSRRGAFEENNENNENNKNNHINDVNSLINCESQKDAEELLQGLREALDIASKCRPLEDVEDLLEIYRLNAIRRSFHGLEEDKRKKLHRLQQKRNVEEIENRMELHRMIIERIAEENEEQRKNHQRLIETLENFNSGREMDTQSAQQSQRTDFHLRQGSEININIR